MSDDGKKELFRVVKKAFAGYGKGAPDAETFEAFASFLKPFTLETIIAALAEHCYSSEFPPTAAAIAGRCQRKDGRPTADEAWATALKGADEAETVIWTTETAQAFFVCKAVLDAGDKIGARMAFRDAYNRMVADARMKSVPVRWETSLGTDKALCDTALQAARDAGQIAYEPAPALAAPEGMFERERIAREVRCLLETLKAKPAELKERRALARLRQREAVEQKKREIAVKVEEYGKCHEDQQESKNSGLSENDRQGSSSQ